MTFEEANLLASSLTDLMRLISNLIFFGGGAEDGHTPTPAKNPSLLVH